MALYVSYGFGGEYLLPPGVYKRPWYALRLSAKKYPNLGFVSFAKFMTEDERDYLYGVFLEQGVEAMWYATYMMDNFVWLIEASDKVRKQLDTEWPEL